MVVGRIETSVETMVDAGRIVVCVLSRVVDSVETTVDTIVVGWTVVSAGAVIVTYWIYEKVSIKRVLDE